MKNRITVASLTCPAKRRKSKSLEKRRARMGYVFVLPFLLGFLFIYLPMIVESLKISFSEIDATVQPVQYNFVGFNNYVSAFIGEDVRFLQELGTNLLELLLDIPAIVIFSLFLAIILNQKMRGRGIFRAIFFIPVIVSTGIIEYIDIAANSMTESMGAVGAPEGDQAAAAGSEIISQIDVQRFFANMAVGQGLVEYVTDLVNNVYGIINRSGVQLLIFLAGLQSISPAIYESAYIEGASSWETFWKITFPMISPMILVNAIYTIIDAFTTESNNVMKYITEINETAGTTNLSLAMAMSWMYFIVILLIIGAVAGIISAYVFYQRRD